MENHHHQQNNRKTIIIVLLSAPFLLTFHALGASIRQFGHLYTIGNLEADSPVPTASRENEEKEWWLGYSPLHGTTNFTHPHLGARHPTNGSLGMVVDPTVKRLAEPRSPQVMISNYSGSHTSTGRPILCPEAVATYGIEGEGGNRVLHKVRRGLEIARSELLPRAANNKENINSIAPPSSSRFGGTNSSARILCMIYTVHTEATRHSAQASIAETWGRECDGFIGASNLTDHSIGAIDLPHEGPEEYGNMWQKIRSIWTYAYDNFINKYDFFYIAGDDTYVLVDHLRLYVESEEVRMIEDGKLDRISQKFAQASRGKAGSACPRDGSPCPIVLAMAMMNGGKPVINGGGGYVLNRAAVELWGKFGADTFRTDMHDSREDHFMAAFFADHGVYVANAQDTEGGWRFAGSADETTRFAGWNSPIKPRKLHQLFNLSINVGIGHISRHQIAFHLKDCKARLRAMNLTIDDLMFRYHAFFNSWCANDNEEGNLSLKS